MDTRARPYIEDPRTGREQRSLPGNPRVAVNEIVVEDAALAQLLGEPSHQRPGFLNTYMPQPYSLSLAAATG